MMRLVDLTGNKYGRLTVIKKSDNKNKNAVWECVCDCGTKKEVAAISLTSGRTKSCGCLNDELRKSRHTNISNKRFGSLTVLRRVGYSGKDSKWECICDCGNKVIRNLHTLKKENENSSCGCVKDKNMKKYYVDGTKTFGLTDTKPYKRTLKDSGRRGVVWDKTRGVWRAQIEFKGKTMYLGRYANLEDAIEAREKAEEKYFKQIVKKTNKAH